MIPIAATASASAPRRGGILVFSARNFSRQDRFVNGFVVAPVRFPSLK